MEVNDLPDKEFKIMVTKIFTELHETHKGEEWMNTELQQRHRKL